MVLPLDSGLACREASTPSAVVVLNQADRVGVVVVAGLAAGVRYPVVPSRFTTVPRAPSLVQGAPPVRVALLPLMVSSAVVAVPPSARGQSSAGLVSVSVASRLRTAGLVRL